MTLKVRTTQLTYYDMSLVQYSRESTFILEIKSYLNLNPGHTQGKNKQTKKQQ